MTAAFTEGLFDATDARVAPGTAAAAMDRHFVLLNAAALPLAALASRLCFRRAGFNCAEHVVFNMYVMAQMIIMTVLIMALLLPLPAVVQHWMAPIPSARQLRVLRLGCAAVLRSRPPLRCCAARVQCCS